MAWKPTRQRGKTWRPKRRRGRNSRHFRLLSWWMGNGIVHINPVNHGYVMRAADWPYSSIHRYIRSGTLPED